jgi:hypothetical protein
VQWLENNGFTFDEIVNAKEGKKSFSETNVLIDDYTRNIKEYLTNTRGVALLVDQPWNREREDLASWIEAERLHVVSNLRDALPVIRNVIRSDFRCS